MKWKYIFLCVTLVLSSKIIAQNYSYRDFEEKISIKEIVCFIRKNTDRFEILSLKKDDALVIDKIETSNGFDFESFKPIKNEDIGIKDKVDYSIYKSKGKIVRIIKTYLDSGVALDYTVFHGEGYKVFIVSRSDSQLLLDNSRDIIGFFVQFEETEKCIFVDTKISFVGQFQEKIQVREISSIMTLNSNLNVDSILLFSDSKLVCLGRVNTNNNGELRFQARFYSDNGVYSNEDNCSQYADLERIKIGKLWHLIYRYEYHCNSYLRAELVLNNDSLDIWNKGLSIK